MTFLVWFSYESKPNPAAAVFTDLCTFNRRTKGAGLIRESSCCCEEMRWKPADYWTSAKKDTHKHSKWGRGSTRSDWRAKLCVFLCISSFTDYPPAPRTLRHPLPATDPLQGAEERKGQTNRDMSPWIKPRGWMRQMLGQGFQGQGWNTVTSDLDVASCCQVSQSQTVSSGERRRPWMQPTNQRSATRTVGVEAGQDSTQLFIYAACFILKTGI